MSTALAPPPPARVQAPMSALRDTVPSAEPSDATLIGRVAVGDEMAFEELHRRYARAIYGLALRRIRDRGRAEDATQDVFAALWRSAARYDAARGVGAAWLFVVARNAVTDALRRTPEPPVDARDETPNGEPGPDLRAEADWETWQVHRAVAGLSDTERPLVELAYWGGMSQSEIASYLGIPLGTVKTRTRAALARLAQALEEELR